MIELIRVLDFETTGLPPDAAVVEVGWADVGVADGAIWGGGSTLVNPGRPIPPEASAIHHIIDADVADAPPLADVLAGMIDEADAFAAHSAAFEMAFFDGASLPWLCTLKAARRVWPEAPGHGNQVLRYWRQLPVDHDLSSPPHRAGPDAHVTAHLLANLLKQAAVADMIQWTTEPSLLPRIIFGKHRGAAWSDVPIDYLDWLVGKSEMDEDVKFTARHELKRRVSAQ